MTKSASNTSQNTNFTAILLGWMLPGLGHIKLGHTRRGYLIMFGVLFLVICGVLVGGVDAVDHKNDGLWFIAQVWCGPVAIMVDLINQLWIIPLPISKRATLVGLSHVNEIGTLFIAMAGLMNFVVLLDVMHAKENDDLSRNYDIADRRRNS